MVNAERWCNDCAWPEQCAARMECQRREAGEVRSAAAEARKAPLIKGLTEGLLTGRRIFLPPGEAA